MLFYLLNLVSRGVHIFNISAQGFASGRGGEMRWWGMLSRDDLLGEIVALKKAEQYMPAL